MTAIVNRLQPRVLWIVGTRLEIEYVNCGGEVITRGTEDLHRDEQITREVGQVSGGR